MSRTALIVEDDPVAGYVLVENLKRLDAIREATAKLADPRRLANPAEAEAIIIALAARQWARLRSASRETWMANSAACGRRRDGRPMEDEPPIG